MDFRAIEFSLRNHVANVVLNRPERANAVTLDVARELMTAANECDEDPDVRAILVRGEGRMFSGGGDLKTFAMQGEA